MKILLIIPYQFVPANSGPKNVIYNLVKFLQNNTVCDLAVLLNSSLLSQQQQIKADIITEFPHLNQVNTFVDQPQKSLAIQIKKLSLLVKGYSPVLLKYQNSEFIKWIKQNRNTKNYDVVHFDMFYTAPYWKYFTQHRKILVPHDAYSSKLSAVEIFDFKTRLQLLFFRRLETSIYKHFELVCPVSQTDANFLKKIVPSLNVTSVPIAVSSEYLQTNNLFSSNNKQVNILCTSSGSAPIVAQEILSFLKTNYPIINQQNPEIKWTILGKHQNPSLTKFTQENQNLELINYVEEYLSFLQQNWIYVYPQNWGSGLKTKIQQAMALGLPIVGSPNAFSGIEVTHGENCLICQTNQEFVSNINLLLNDRALREKIGKQAHQLIKENYSVEAVGSKMLDIYNMMIKQNMKTNS